MSEGRAGAASTPTLDVGAARSLWAPAGPYLNTASYGLPPAPAFAALEAALADWRGGRRSWEGWGEATGRSRALFSELVGVPPERVAVGATVSQLVGLVATALAPDARVVVPDVEFTSNLFPWMMRARVECVPAERLAEAIDSRTRLVAFSAVQSATGAVADIDAILSAARQHGALTVVDATQACGWLELDAARFDGLVCAAYKWLMSPRGTAFLALGDELLELVEPLAAGWYAGEDPHASYYGPPLRLAASARRLDTSPAWFSWVGTEPAIELVRRLGVRAIGAHDVALANRFRAGLGLDPSNSAIVSVDVAGAEQRLERAGIRASVRAGSLRASFHLYNTTDDVDAALDALAG